MDSLLYETLYRYFTHLSNTGYEKDKDVKKVLLYTALIYLLNNDFRGLITEEDYKYINNVLYCLFGSTCLIPYPDYYSSKNNQIMYSGSISEILHRLEDVEDVIINPIKAEIVIPGDEVKETEDLD